MTEEPDTILVKQALDGDRRAIDALLLRHEDELRRFLATRVHSDQVDDFTQEVFLRALISIDQLKDPGRFRPWLLGVAANLVRMSYRSQRAQTFHLDEYERSTQSELEITGRGVGPERDLLVSERAAAVRNAVASLPDALREVVELHYLEGLAYTEIAERIGVRLYTIEGRLYRARQRLKEELKMTQSTTDLFELKEQLEDLQAQVGELRDQQKLATQEDAISIQQERNAAASQLCRLSPTDEQPITWGVVGAFRSESRNHKRTSIWATSIDNYVGFLEDDQIANGQVLRVLQNATA